MLWAITFCPFGASEGGISLGAPEGELGSGGGRFVAGGETAGGGGWGGGGSGLSEPGYNGWWRVGGWSAGGGGKDEG